MTGARFLPPPTRPARTLVVAWLDGFLRSKRGRLVMGATLVAALDHSGLPLPGLLTVPAWIVFWCAVGWAGLRLTLWALRRLLWRIRTKLLMSYLFVAVVPLVLGSILVLLATLLFTGLVGAHLVSSEVDRSSDVLRAATSAVWDGLPKDATAAQLDARLAAARTVHPDVAFTLVRGNTPVAQKGGAPLTLPAWLQGESFTGLVTDGERDVVRAVRRAAPGDFLVLDAPLDPQLLRGLTERTGIALRSSGGNLRKEERNGGLHIEVDGPKRRRWELPDGQGPGMSFLAPVQCTDWANGTRTLNPVEFMFVPWEVMRRLVPGPFDIPELLLKLLAVVAIFFMAMYVVALLIGFGLARSITKSIHGLTAGTERLRLGEFDRPIPVGSRDQLGELAESFNIMSRGIVDLLREQGEKERLEEELRIARQIQMKLLPQGTITMAGLRIAAVCLPATEVGGDYYDLLPLSPTRMGVLVADVSGKGTSAALYMAELKGLVLSLSRIYDSPARLLSEANRILAANMDSRTFITMTYAVLDVGAGTMRFARAGHNPLIRFEGSTGTTIALTPAGLGLGMDKGDRFDEILEEVEVPLVAGDVFLFFTDGLSEAMNPRSELFGEDRLREVVRATEALDTDTIKERILGEIRSFVSGAAQHDDMTMVVVKIG